MKDQISSEIVHVVESKKFGIIGYLVIDRLIGGISSGGVRITPDISLLELQLIAKSMTYKNAFVGDRTGGAKAAVIIDQDNLNYRDEILKEFGKSISPFIRNRMYSPRMDMGIRPEDLQIIFDGARIRSKVLSWKNTSHEYAAYSCFYATLCALEKKNISLKDVTFSVQGFGKVGSIYAYLMSRAGARLIAFSNKHFGLINENGFEVNELLQGKSAYGDDFILTQSGGKQVKHNEIFETEVTVLLPAANALAINAKNWDRIKANIIICAANAPMNNEIERQLFQKGKTVVIDFVANCGGVLGSIMDNYVKKDVILHILSTSYKRKVAKLINQSTLFNTPMVDIAIAEVEKTIETDFQDISPPKSSTKYISNLFNLAVSRTLPGPINKIININMENEYKSRYELLWG